MAQAQFHYKVEGVEEFNVAVNLFITEFKRDALETLTQYSKLLALDFMFVTPPFANPQGGDSKADQRIGEAAVERDISNAITPWDRVFTEDFTNKRMEDYIRRKDYDKLNRAMENFPKLRAWKAEPFDPKFHLDKRLSGNRYRIPKSQKILTADTQKWNRYVKEMKKRVGWVKAGWGKCAAALGGKVPGWIATHIGYSRGVVTVKEAAEGGFPSIEISNEVPYIEDLQHRYEYAIKNRVERMLTDMAKKMNHNAKNKGLSA
jgi:hypothetical protein